MKWNELTYFGKGVVIGTILWLVIVVLVIVQGMYLNTNLQKMNPSLFYIFNGTLGLYEMVLVGIFLIVAIGAIGWLYGRVVGEIV